MTIPPEAQLDRLRKRAAREKQARLEAERLLEDKSRALFEANQRLANLNANLEDLVRERTEALERAHENALALADQDQLTGLANRRSFKRFLARRAEAHGQECPPVTLILIDLDYFKDVNDTFGHAAGDALLRAVALRLQEIQQGHPGALAARLGGDEFAFVLRSRIGSPELHEGILGDLLVKLRAPVSFAGTHIFPTCSLGVACMPEDAQTPEELQNHADIALYRAKRNGRNQWAVFEPAMLRETQERQVFVSGLRRAIEGDEFEIWYQPQICLATNRVWGLEALARWRHPEFGDLSPARFIPYAEEAGLMTDLTRNILDQVLRTTATWFDDHGLERVSVNVSPRDFRDSALSEMIEERLAAHQVPAQRLEIEITENVLLWDFETARRELDRLSGMGVELALDDFGTGYSNLSYLHSLSFGCLKIDRSFVADLAAQVDSRSIVTAVIQLAHSLHMRVVAEGVEHPEQKAILKQMGCDIVQGYLTGRPMDAQACVAFLNDARSRAPSSLCDQEPSLKMG